MTREPEPLPSPTPARSPLADSIADTPAEAYAGGAGAFFARAETNSDARGRRVKIQPRLDTLRSRTAGTAKVAAVAEAPRRPSRRVLPPSGALRSGWRANRAAPRPLALLAVVGRAAALGWTVADSAKVTVTLGAIASCNARAVAVDDHPAAFVTIEAAASARIVRRCHCRRCRLDRTSRTKRAWRWRTPCGRRQCAT